MLIPRTGDRVRITGLRGSVIGTIQRCCTPAELPELPADQMPAGHAAATAIFQRVAASLLEEQGVDHVAMISYQTDAVPPVTLVFAALRIKGRWQDLSGQIIDIEPDRAN